MSYDGWLVPHGPFVASLDKLPELFDRIRREGEAFLTEDDIDGTELYVDVVARTSVPDAEHLDVPGDGESALQFSGRKVVHFDLSLVDLLAPNGGTFVYEDGETAEIEPAASPSAVRAVIDAVLADDAPKLLRALDLVPEDDRWRLPDFGIARIARAHPHPKLASFVGAG